MCALRNTTLLELSISSIAAKVKCSMAHIERLLGLADVVSYLGLHLTYRTRH